MSPAVLALGFAIVVSVAITRWVPVPTDEAWFLEVVHRVRRGDRLYEDVFFGAGPVPVWLATTAVRLSRPQVVVIRALTLTYGFAIWVAGAALLTAAGIEAGLAALFVIGAVALGGHHLVMENHYGQLSALGVVIAALGVVHGEWWITGAGILLALSAKYPLGALAAIWALPLLAVDAGFDAVLGAGLLVAAGVVAVALALGPEGVRSFFSVAIANKGTYLSRAGINPARDLLHRLGASHHSLWYRIISSVGPVAVFVVAVLGALWCVAGLIVGVGAGSTTLLVAAALSGTGLAVAFPRADHNHLVAAMPLVQLGLVLAIGELGLPSGVLALAGAGALVVLAATLAATVLETRIADVRRDLPRLRLLPVAKLRGVWPDDTEALRALAGDEVFVLRIDAPYFYLAGQIRNPTPYDYPLASTFGPHGQARVAVAISSGQVRWVCYPVPIQKPLGPTELQQFIEQMTSVGDTPVGRLYDAAITARTD